MNKLKRYTILFALAVIIAGVFIVGFCGKNTERNTGEGIFIAVFPAFAYAEQAHLPWNVDVEIVLENDAFRYDLSEQITSFAQEATKRGFYLSYNGKRALADSLIDQGLPRVAAYEYLLPNFKQIVKHFAYVNRDRIDSEVDFSPSGFTYSKSQDGVSIDLDKLFDLMISSRGKHVKVSLPLAVDKATSATELKKYTVKKSSFTTTYYNSSESRCYNIALATKSLNGLTIRPDEIFSFNNAVGDRTEANGYKNAKVILDGAYTDGVGGGVCQVSTTLYNALLLAGFVPKASQHSLVSSYVMAGFDAMVAYGSTDLTFTNNTSHNIYIEGKTQGKTVTFTIYGEANEYEIERENIEERQPFGTVEIVDKVKYPELVYVDQVKIITNGSDGVKTKSYLKYYKDGKLVATKLIRSNNYKRVDKVIARGDKPRPDEAIGEGVAVDSD